MAKELFEIFERHAFDDDHCFLCGSQLNPLNRTAEHVFPLWLQKRFNIQNYTLTLLNGTRIPYRLLKIPCCASCNNGPLSRLEARVQSAVESGGFLKLPDEDINCWLTKIFIGIIWKECQLRVDLRGEIEGSIFRREDMQWFRMAHFYLQSLRVEIRFHTGFSPFPNSLIRLRCKEHGERVKDFDFKDSLFAHSIGIRMGSEAAVLILDGGIHSYIFPDFEEKFNPYPLHPIQFTEIFCKASYKSIKLKGVPYFALIGGVDGAAIDCVMLAIDNEEMNASLNVATVSGAAIILSPNLDERLQEYPIYGDWIQEEYAMMLANYLGLPIERVFLPPDLVMSWLRDEDENWKDIPIHV